MASTTTTQKNVTAKVLAHQAKKSESTVKVDWTPMNVQLDKYIQENPASAKHWQALMDITVEMNPYGGTNPIPSAIERAFGRAYIEAHPEARKAKGRVAQIDYARLAQEIVKAQGKG